eukprot:TRINITY_DN1575_c0_g1_i1.p1 TRINITY_DN1575_c0_g1~~TRINITY_DN1575_c0_g1_i1.p1  ORF type:complete len:269 (-),score=54.74 TRINITY_DN1575_c0_g1_i1:50-856(-)
MWLDTNNYSSVQFFHNTPAMFRKMSNKQMRNMRKLLPESMTKPRKPPKEGEEENAQGGMGMRRMVFQSTGKVADPYNPLEPAPNMLTKKYFTHLYNIAKRFIITRLWSPYMVRSSLKKLSPPEKYNPKFYRKEAERIFVKFNELIISGDYKADDLREICSDQYVSKLIRQAQKDKKKIPKTMSATWSGNNIKVSIQNSNVLALPDPIGMTFVQVMFKIKSSQIVTISDNTGKEISKKGPYKMTEYWVLERCISQPNFPWLLVEKLKKA